MEKNSPTADPILLLGFTLAHAVWSICDAKLEEFLCPLAFIENDGKLELVRFESETQEDAIAEGKDHINLRKKVAVVSSFAREGLITDKDDKVDVILVESWSNRDNQTYGVIHKFVPNRGKGHFKLLDEPMFLINGEIQTEEVTIELMNKLEQGVQSHSKVAPLWRKWKDK